MAAKQLRELKPLEQATNFAGGAGTPSSPYLIATPEQLNRVRSHHEAHYRLACDIDLNGYLFECIPHFAGVFDGCGFTIANWSYRDPPGDVDHAALFANVYGIIVRTHLRNVEMASARARNMASLVGCLHEKCKVIGCSVVGGRIICLGIENGRSPHCAAWAVAGLIATLGGVSKAVVRQCSADIEVIVEGSSSVAYAAGGLIGGMATRFTIEDCYSLGTVTGECAVGGLAAGSGTGGSIVTLRHCFARQTPLIGLGSTQKLEDCFVIKADGMFPAHMSEADKDLAAKYLRPFSETYPFQEAGYDMQNIWAPGATHPVLRPSTFDPYEPEFVEPEPVFAPIVGEPQECEGHGTPEAPWIVKTAWQLDNMVRAKPESSFQLAADIDLTGLLFLCLPPFTGHFCGDYHVIRGWRYAGEARDQGSVSESGLGPVSCVGLFSEIHGSVTRLIMDDTHVVAKATHVGGLVGRMHPKACVHQCAIRGKVCHLGGINGFGGGQSCGGLVGSAVSDPPSGTAMINECASYADVDGYHVMNTGGLFGGDSWSFGMGDCYAMGTVSGYWMVGGISGGTGQGSTSAKVLRCYFGGTVPEHEDGQGFGNPGRPIVDGGVKIEDCATAADHANVLTWPDDIWVLPGGEGKPSLSEGERSVWIPRLQWEVLAQERLLARRSVLEEQVEVLDGPGSVVTKPSKEGGCIVG